MASYTAIKSAFASSTVVPSPSKPKGKSSST
nr:MAG TPA: hypothetical protein [Caudoviricetes sp.]